MDNLILKNRCREVIEKIEVLKLNKQRLDFLVKNGDYDDVSFREMKYRRGAIREGLRDVISRLRDIEFEVNWGKMD